MIAACPMPITPGARFGPYQVIAPLGRGGMGEVYRAHDDRIERQVALKLLASGSAADPDRLRRFEQEARTAGLLNHPNIATVFDVGSHDGLPYLVCELLGGETLRERMARGCVPSRDASRSRRRRRAGSPPRTPRGSFTAT